MTPEELAARGVRVKALSWSDFEHVYQDGSGSKLGAAVGDFGISYAIYKSPKDGIHVIGIGSAFAAYSCPFIESAKSAAQADYAARICAALEGVTE